MAVRRIIISLLRVVFMPGLYASAGLIWPTPNQAFQRGEPIEAFVQPTVSGKVESGLFGCVRNDGAKFHEGLDLFPIQRKLTICRLSSDIFEARRNSRP